MINDINASIAGSGHAVAKRRYVQMTSQCITAKTPTLMKGVKNGNKSKKVKVGKLAPKRPPDFLGEELLTPDQACAYLDINRSNLLYLTRTGEMPALRVGGSYRYKKELLYQWCKKR